MDSLQIKTAMLTGATTKKRSRTANCRLHRFNGGHRQNYYGQSELQADCNVWRLGGASLTQNFAQFDLIDEIILTIVPQTLKTGIPLGLSFEQFKLIDEKALIDGMIQKMYVKK